MMFKELGLLEPLLRALEDANHTVPTPIQEQAIPLILEGRDILGCAQTGTGKTAAFALPLIQHLLKGEKNNYQKDIKVLVLSPTRELAIQTRDNFRKYGQYTDIKCGVILGGVNQRSQVEVLKRGVDILVATPGRLLDLIDQHYVKLNKLDILVLDEADTMLDMGFIHDVKKIMSYVPESRQTLLFSATMPSEINNLAVSFLKNYEVVKVNTVTPTIDKINQSLYYVDKNNKAKLLLEILMSDAVRSALVFTRTKHGANKLAEFLDKGGLSCDVIHGNKSQSARVAALNNFKSGKSSVLVATDIAARGIDIIELSHVINYEIPNLAETYLHRIGRTGRAGRDGIAISLCSLDEKCYIRDIQRLIKQEIPTIDDHKYPMLQINFTPKEPTRETRREPKKNFNYEKRNNGKHRGYYQNKALQR